MSGDQELLEGITLEDEGSVTCQARLEAREVRLGGKIYLICI